VTDALDPHARRLLDMLALRGGGAATLGVADRRAAFANLMRFGAPSPDIGRVENILAGRPIRLFRPKDVSATGIVFFHGGGLVAGSLDTHDALCRTLAATAQCNIFAVDYRLAPEYVFPAALDDALAALAWIFQNASDYGLDGIGIAGDSAGGTLAAVAAASWRARECQALAFQLLLCPILDFAGETPSRRAFASPILDQAMLDRDVALYAAGKVPVDDVRVSPLRAADFSRLPPTFLHTAQCDPLREEGAIYAEKLRKAGVEVHHTCHTSLPHLFYGLSDIVPAAKAATTRVGVELAAWLAKSVSHRR
jgi:acetyl esterase/lipase